MPVPFGQWHCDGHQVVLVAMQPEMARTVPRAFADQKIGIIDEAFADLPFPERVQ